MFFPQYPDEFIRDGPRSRKVVLSAATIEIRRPVAAERFSCEFSRRPVSFLSVDEFISGQETDVLGYSAAPHENNPKNYGAGPDHARTSEARESELQPLESGRSTSIKALALSWSWQRCAIERPERGL